MSVLEELNEFAADLGIRRRPMPKHAVPLWDGETLVELDEASNLAHEIAHWMLAGEERRGLVDYGWTFDWQWMSPDEGAVSWSDGGQEEVRASVLGFSFLARLRFDPKKLYSLWEEYGFYGVNVVWPDDEDADPIETNELDLDLAERRAVQPHVVVFNDWLARKRGAQSSPRGLVSPWRS